MASLSSRFEGAGGAQPPGVAAAPEFVLVGTLQHVLEWASLVAVDRPGRLEARVHVNSDTRFTVDGRAAPLRALRPGRSVRVVFDLVGDAAVASEIVSPAG